MKSYMKYISTILILVVVVLFSCKKDFLNTQPLGEVSSEVVWKDGPLATAFITNLYNGLGPGGLDEQMLASLTDEAVFTHTGRGINTVNEGSLSPSNTGWTHSTYEWGSMYGRIRGCNVALQNLGTATFDDAVLKQRLFGETYFLRAYFYHQLVRYYGGVPIIKKVYGLNEDYTAERNTFDDCVKFILSDCDSAILNLKGKTTGKGRATMLSAMALKSRMLLYAASDLHDIPTAKANSAVISAFSKPELLGYISGNRTTRWTDAQTAAKAVMDASSGYKFGLSALVTPEEGRLNYVSIAMGGGSTA